MLPSHLSLSQNPQLSSEGDPFLTSWDQTDILLAPLENLVTVVSGYDLCSNRQHRQSDVFTPLAAIRILLVAGPLPLPVALLTVPFLSGLLLCSPLADLPPLL
jgi:hypothetical protein